MLQQQVADEEHDGAEVVDSSHDVQRQGPLRETHVGLHTGKDKFKCVFIFFS